MAGQRVSPLAAYVLHRYDWSETSLILEVFTRHHGRLALVAKGVKRPTSSFRPVLLPLQLLRLSYGGEGEVRTLKGAEWAGGHVMPGGEALLSGYYLNELILRHLAREDAHAALFDVYTQVVATLAQSQEALLQTALRAFELSLLREVGLLPRLDQQTLILKPLETARRYVLVSEGGLRSATSEEPGMDGPAWEALQQALDAPADFAALLRACAPVVLELKTQLRALLQYHGGGAALRTRQLMIDLQSL